MVATLDRNFFTQIGLDSGALTMLGVIVHTFGEASEYRGAVISGDGNEAIFYVSVDPGCAVAGVNIDLAALAGTAPGAAAGGQGPRYVVHPKGYAVFRVAGGPGGYAVSVRKAVEDPEVTAYDTRALQPGDIFSAILMRPGRYSVRNVLGDAKAEVTVSYPGDGKAAYKPPAPEAVELGETIEPAHIRLKPMQGMNFNVRTAARIVIELQEADDGPRAREAATD